MQDEIGAVIDMNRFHGADVSALLGFKILGHEAEAAIPELHRLTQDTNHPAISVRAAQCLIYVSGEKEALAASSQLLTTPNAIIRRMTTNALATIAPGIFQTNDVLTNRTRKF
jgi:hypothetical protein